MLIFMSLDITDLELLIILQEKPVANDSTLARLTGLSSPTVKRRIDRLHEVKAIERIQALIDYNKIGLIIVATFINVPYNNYTKVQALLSKNPYIYYQVRNFGAYNGIHATFRIPSNGYNNLKLIFDELVSSDLITNYDLFHHDLDQYEIRTKPRFIVYNSKTNKWDWNFLKWVDVPLDRLYRGIEEHQENNLSETPELNELDIIDLEILSILSLNSRIKNVDILDSLSQKISPQRLSDRLRFLKKYFISNYRVYLNWYEIFNFQGFVFIAYCDNEVKKYFKILLKYRPPPFETTFREFDKGFILYVICPSNHMLDLINVLDSKVNKLEINILDYQTSERYELKSESFDQEKKYWRFDKDYMIPE